MTDEEYERVQARAIALGVSVPRALVESATGAPILTRTERAALHAELLAMRRLLANLANNVNQIARALNGDVDVSPAQITAALESTARAGTRVEEMAEKHAS